MGDIYGQYGISFAMEGGISAGSFGDITVVNGVIFGAAMNTEFTAKSSGYGDISVTNLDADYVAAVMEDMTPTPPPPAPPGFLLMIPWLRLCRCCPTSSSSQRAEAAVAVLAISRSTKVLIVSRSLLPLWLLQSRARA